MPEGGTKDEPLVVVSPHPDDAAYSVGGMLSGHAFGGSVHGVTVFTRSQAMIYGEPALSRAVGKPLGLTSQPRVNRLRRRLKVMEVTRIRRREDVSYFRTIGVPRVDFEQLDAPLRGYGWSPFVSDMEAVRKDPINKVLVSEFRNFIESLNAESTPSAAQASGSTVRAGPCVILLPLGLGGHVDHLIVREACSGLALDSVRIYFEDLPYASRMTSEEIERFVRGFDSELRPHLFNIKASLSKKIENLRLYKSQVGDKELERVRGYANRLGASIVPCERLWYSPLPEDNGVRRSLDLAELERG